MNPPDGLRLVFAGTPGFAAVALTAIAAAGHEVVLVLTRADKPAGRGRALHESRVRQLARERGFAVEQPRNLRDASLQARLRSLGADVMVVAAYGLILPAEVLAIPRHGCLNIHASLLPRWRGAAPIQRAIEAGDAHTGITIMQMDEGLDTGPVLLAEREPILSGDTGGSLQERLAALGARAVVAALARLRDGTLRAQAQPAEGVTYAHKLTRADAMIDWLRPARRIVDQVRAFDPVPGATALLERMPEAPIKVWSASPAAMSVPAATRPGTVLSSAHGQLQVACGDAAVDLRELQRPGGRRLPVAEFLRGCPLDPGERFLVPGAT